MHVRGVGARRGGGTVDATRTQPIRHLLKAVDPSRRPQGGPRRPPAGARRRLRPRPAAVLGGVRRCHGRVRCSISAEGYGRPPQIRLLFPVHTLGTGKLSQPHPQCTLATQNLCRSPACGSVDEGRPQTVDDEPIHRLCIKLSTANPQAAAGCPQRSLASPHGCPLFGNVTRLLTGASESRHIMLPRGAVGKDRKPGDAAGENSASPVHGMCRTFRSPQKGQVVHGRRPQGRWTKNRC